MTCSLYPCPAFGDRTQIPARARLKSFRLHLAIWTLQGWLAMFFIGAAFAKLTEPMVLLDALLGWTKGVEPILVRAIGAAELFLGLGLLAPLISWRVFGSVMAVAAFGIAIAGFAMAGLYLKRLEFGFAGLNLVLAVAAAAVFLGRCSIRRKDRLCHGQVSSVPVRRTEDGL